MTAGRGEHSYLPRRPFVHRLRGLGARLVERGAAQAKRAALGGWNDPPGFSIV